MKVVKGYVTFFFLAEIRKSGPIKEEEVTPGFLSEKIDQWRAQPQGGQIAAEPVTFGPLRL